MPVCLALLNLLLLIVDSAAVCQFFLLAYCFPSAGLRGVDPLTPEVVMNFTRGNVYAGSVYTVNLCAFLHA